MLKTQLLACDTPATLRQERTCSHVVIEVEGSSEPIEQAIGSIAEIPDIVARLVGDGKRSVRVTPTQRSLEDVYLELVG